LEITNSDIQFLKNNATKKNDMITVFIDESGILPDVKDRFIVVCGVATKQIKEVENIFSRILKSLRQRKTRIKEIKFYHAGQNTKRQFLSGIAAAGFKVFALIIDKKNRKIVDSPENFALILKSLIIDIISWNKNEPVSFFLDKHFQKKTDINRFNNFIKVNIAKTDLKIKHVACR